MERSAQEREITRAASRALPACLPVCRDHRSISSPIIALSRHHAVRSYMFADCISFVLYRLSARTNKLDARSTFHPHFTEPQKEPQVSGTVP